jgi:hypothetical protein
MLLEIKGGKDSHSDSYEFHDYDGSDSGDGANMLKRTSSKRGLLFISRKQGAL